MRAIVTGASGFLGGAVLKRLSETGFDCLGLSRKEIHGLCQVASYVDTPKGDILIHLAEANARTTANAGGAALESEARQTLEALLSKGYRQVIYASSAVLYGDRRTTPRKVSDPVEAVDTYTRIKLHSERAVLAQGGTVVRRTNLYGPGMAEGNVLSHILNQLGRSTTITMHSLEPVRDFLWIEDAAQALSEIVTRAATGVFNIGSGRGTSVRQLVDIAQTAAATHQEVTALHTVEQPSYLVLDITATEKALGWTPKTELEQGVLKLVNMKMKPENCTL